MSAPSPDGRPAAGGILPLLLLTGRPASGKSEILEYLRRTPAAERRRRFHIGEPVVLDDFPLLWAWFEEDHLLAEMGRERLHTTPDGYFLGPAPVGPAGAPAVPGIRQARPARTRGCTSTDHRPAGVLPGQRARGLRPGLRPPVRGRAASAWP